MVTTIQIEEKLKNKLEEMKTHRRETYNEVIKRLIASDRQEENLSEQSLKNIESALEDIKKGKVYSTSEVRKSSVWIRYNGLRSRLVRRLNKTA